MRLKAKTTCPYCGHSQLVTVAHPSGQEIVICYPEDGGCDKYYSVFYRTTATANSYKIEIPEQENQEVAG